MLIVLGGFLGSGRKALAQKLADCKGMYLYDMEAKYMHTLVRGKDGTVSEVKRRPTKDFQRLWIYQRVLQELPMLSKLHPDTIVDAVFQRRQPRKYFLEEAKKYFKPVVFVWIDSDESHVEERLRWMKARRIIPTVEDGIRRRQAAANLFDGLDPGERVFKCVRGDAAEADALWTLIQGVA